MKKIIIISVLIIALVALGILVFKSFISYQNPSTPFLANIKNLSQDIVPVENFTPNSFQSIQPVGDGWYTINADDVNPSRDIYYIDPSGPTSSNAFTSSTHITLNDINILTNILNKYPYIGEFQSDVNLNAQYLGQKSPLYNDVAIEFYLPNPGYSLWSNVDERWYKIGFIYMPFQPSDLGEQYINKNFGTLTEVTSDWYEFSVPRELGY